MKTAALGLLFSALALVFAPLAPGQCAMCFRTAEAQSRAQAQALNKGIVVLAVPLLAAAAVIARLAHKRGARSIH